MRTCTMPVPGSYATAVQGGIVLSFRKRSILSFDIFYRNSTVALSGCSEPACGDLPHEVARKICKSLTTMVFGFFYSRWPRPHRFC